MKQILIADDTADMRQLLRLTLEPLGAQLCEAADGEQALEQARRTRPDLVILDVMMPGQDGYAVCRALRSDPQLAHTLVLLLTACAQKTDEELARAAGAHAFVVKPFSPDALLQRVARALT